MGTRDGFGAGQFPNSARESTGFHAPDDHYADRGGRESRGFRSSGGGGGGFRNSGGRGRMDSRRESNDRWTNVRKNEDDDGERKERKSSWKNQNSFESGFAKQPRAYREGEGREGGRKVTFGGSFAGNQFPRKAGDGYSLDRPDNAFGTSVGGFTPSKTRLPYEDDRKSGFERGGRRTTSAFGNRDRGQNDGFRNRSASQHESVAEDRRSWGRNGDRMNSSHRIVCHRCGREGHTSWQCTKSVSSEERSFGGDMSRSFTEGFARGGKPGNNFARGFGRSPARSDDRGRGSSSDGFGFSASIKGSRDAEAFNRDSKKSTGSDFRVNMSGGSNEVAEMREFFSSNGWGKRQNGSKDFREPRERGFGEQKGNSFKCFICGKKDHRTSSCPLKEQKKEGRPLVYRPEPQDVDELYKVRLEAGHRVEEFFNAEVLASRDGKVIAIKPLELYMDKIPEVLLKNMEKMRFERLMPVQRYAYPIISSGADLMACAQTGTGKTVAYLLPVLVSMMNFDSFDTNGTCTPRCLVVAPTRELAVQIFNEARKFAYGTRCEVAVLYGGTSTDFQLSRLPKGNVMLIATIGRLLEMIRNKYVWLKKLKYVILDEADRMLDMGFARDVDELFSHPDMPNKDDERQTLMFSATFPYEVQKLAQNHLRENFIMLAIGALGSANRCIKQEFIEVRTPFDKKEALLELLDIDVRTYKVEGDDVFKRKTLVFVRVKDFADTLGAVICQAGVECTTIHGDRYQYQREEALQAFREGKIPVLIATAVAARGLDISGVDHVINYDLPDTRNEYIHRIGRTGRIGNPGRATSFYNSETNRELAADLVAIIEEAQQEPPAFLLRDIGVTGSNKFGGGWQRATAARISGQDDREVAQVAEGIDETDTKIQDAVSDNGKKNAVENAPNDDW